MARLSWVYLLAALTPALAVAQEMRPDTRSTSGPEAELMALEEQWAEALRQGDAATLERVLADDLVYTGVDGVRRSKPDEIAMVKSGRVQVETFTSEPMQVKVFGDVAVVIGGHTEKSTFDGEDSSGRYRWTRRS